MQARFPSTPILFCPEFLRERYAYSDALNPSRIVIGGEPRFTTIMEEIVAVLHGFCKNNPPIRLLSSLEAEASKLFSNTYLALRVAFFNELDSLSKTHGMDSGKLIESVCLDPRIGEGYNNPSFGYGGYCLPKDSKQLLSSFSDVPQTLIDAVVTSNAMRKRFIIEDVYSSYPPSLYPTLGFYNLGNGARQARSSASVDILKGLMDKGYAILVYDPFLEYVPSGARRIEDYDDFLAQSDLILADRIDERLSLALDKVYTRDKEGKE